MEQAFLELKERLAQVEDLRAAADVLEWDQETYMPPGAGAARAAQIATIRRLAHERFTDEAVGALLEKLAPEVEDRDPLSFEASLVRVARRDYAQATKLSVDLVGALAEAVSLAKEAWKEAKDTDAFPVFAPHLQRLVELNVEKAEALGYEDRRYDALLDQYEPGLKTAEVERVFQDLAKKLVPIVHAIAEREPPDDSFLHQPFPEEKQWAFGVSVIRDFGYDFERGRQDHSLHPFSTAFAISDVRITTRVDEAFLNPALFGTLHEAGHALYEQGIDPELERTPLADGTSLAMHESQSRLWEILVGRSRPFWQQYYPRLQATFPAQLGGVSLDKFYRAVNKVQPSLIRVEADGLTYNLHIMLRFDLEQALIEGRVGVNDLPALWNETMHDYLGLRPQNDAKGVLQDIHWSLGAFGYFPTYALGNLISAQLFEKIRADLPDLDEEISRGRFAPLLHWLRTHVHQHGRKLTATEILERTTGQGLTAEPWLAFVREKYDEVYGVR